MRRRKVLAGASSAISSVFAGCLGDTDEVGNGSEDAQRDDSDTTPDDTGADDDTKDPGDDVDGDGFTVCHERNILGPAEVGRMDIFVEVGWTPEVRPEHDELNRLIEIYDDAPMDATHGAEEGVNLHVEYGNELPMQSEPVSGSDIERLADEYFDNGGYGYHYAVFVEELDGDGLGWARDGLVAVQATGLPNEFSTLEIFAHELGHSLGLDRDVFDGIDSHDTPFEDYPSIMNYAAIHDHEEEYLDFSDGTNAEGDFDDWGYLEENLYTPDMSQLESDDDC